MFSMEEMLSKRNQTNAMNHLLQKKNGSGHDGMMITEFEEYWKTNHEHIEESLKKGEYVPGVVMTYEILNGKGKVREVCSLNVTDRFVARLLSQKMRRYIEPLFCKNSFAYQEGKGILDAVIAARDYINAGDSYVAEIDIKHFFDTINHERMMNIVNEQITDERIRKLIHDFLTCKLEQEDHFYTKTVGIVQGNSISPILSNMYLHELDLYMEEKGYHWVRFSDDLNIYSDSQENAVKIYEDVAYFLKTVCKLETNEKKSGIYSVKGRIFLGYDFYKKNNAVEVRKHIYKKVETYQNWNKCAIQKVNQEYHIIQNGVINKKDYALLFENEKEKHHIPVEVLDQMSIYSNVTISSSVMQTLAKENIRVLFLNKFGELVGTFVPEGYEKDAKVTLQQALKYSDDAKRLENVKIFEEAGLHNMRSNLKYYNKKVNIDLNSQIQEFNRMIIEVQHTSQSENAMLVEARAKKIYYQSFNMIIDDPAFTFSERSKRPPKDPINAMISFGNILLYNEILRMMWKTSLNPQIGVVHAANRRNYSLHLDFADLYKPITVDRVIFHLINGKQIKREDFIEVDEGGIYLNNTGKKIFVKAFQDKMESHLVIKNRETTYRQLIYRQLQDYQRYIMKGEKFKPYKYY